METLAARIARAGPLPDRDAVGWVVRLAKRIEKLHARGTVHGRLSAACVVMEGEPCASRGWLSDPLATPAFVSYRSPERAAGEGPSRQDDTWALAVTLYVALSGRLPFPAESDRELRRLQSAGAAPRATLPGAAGDALWRVLEQALARDPKQRIAEVEALRRALEAARPDEDLEALPPLDEHPLAEPPKTVPAPRPSSSGMRGASSSQPPARRSSPPQESSGGSQPPARRSTPPRESSGSQPPARRSAPPREGAGGSQPPRRSSPPRESSGSQPAARRSAPPHGRTSSQPPPSAGSTARRTPVPLQGLATMGLRSTAGAPTTPVPEAPDRPAKAPSASPSAPPEIARATQADASGSPPGPAVPPPALPEPPVVAAAQSEPPVVAPAQSEPPVVAAAQPEPPFPSPEAAPPAAGDGPESPRPVRDLPPLVDDEMPPEPSDPFALAPDSAAAHVGAPARGAPPAPAVAPAPRPRRKPSAARRAAAIALWAVAVAGAAAAAWFWLRHRDAATPRPPVPALSAAPAAGADPTGPDAQVAHDAGAEGAAAQEATTDDAGAAAPEPADASATSATPAEGSADFAACMAPLFPGGSVDAEAAGQLSFVCAEVDPMKGVAALKSHLAQAAGAGGVSDATKEWAVLGWYDMATLAALRARCCDAPPPFELPRAPEGCPPVDAALNDLGAAVASASSPGDRALAKAARRYTRTVQCVVRVGAASRYGRKNKPNGGEASAFKKVLARALRDEAQKR
ncbi:serine/threonine protein kinase [Sorangium sp. So ce388]|uniref:serine/threonine protein kinase n=1 Tax=Sorangium sp. So ce388 TaxID=3133309 RepID=UPI003F5B8CB0